MFIFIFFLFTIKISILLVINEFVTLLCNYLIIILIQIKIQINSAYLGLDFYLFPSAVFTYSSSSIAVYNNQTNTKIKHK
jgi:hypothetical protein